MKIGDLFIGDLEKVYKLYDENEKWLDCDILDFITNYLERCECCGEVVFKEDLQDREMWDGKHRMCCLDCQKEVDEDNDNDVSEPDPYDIYMDKKMEQEM